jgi:single-strand DNA-binding protein
MNMNKAYLMGRLGNDPVLRITQKGTKVVTFSLATQDYIKSKNENETTWHRIVLWGQAADFCSKYIKKGDPVYIDGSMKVRKFEGDDGKVNYMHEIHSMKVQRLGNKKDRTTIEDESSTELVEQHHQS